MVLSFLLNAIDNLILVLNAHAFDLNLDTNNNILWFFMFMGKCNHFFPIFDGYFPILGMYILVYGFLTTTKIAEVFLNLIRGSGARL